MHLYTALAVASSAGLAAAYPLNGLVSRAVAAFPAGSSWDIILNRNGSHDSVKLMASQNVSAFDVDLFDTKKEVIVHLKATTQVICYFSAGSKEGWRADGADFKAGDIGKSLDGWADENWVNVTSENVRAIMKKRIELAAANGCAAIDPDNIDGFSDNQDGFGYDQSAYVNYIKFLASTAAANNLAMGLKNAVDIIPDVLDVVQFAVNEQCHEYKGECASYKPFTDANKAIFNIEYGTAKCDSPTGVKLSTLIKPADQALNTLGGACAGQAKVEQPGPVESGTAVPTAAAAAPVDSSPPIVAPATSASALVTSQPTTPQPSHTRVAAQPTSTGIAGDDGGDDDDTEEEEEYTNDANVEDEDVDEDDKEDDEEDEEDEEDEVKPTATARPRPSIWRLWHRPGQNASD